ALDAGSIYLSDYGNNVVRKIDPSGTITTVAGNGSASSGGDGGPAVEASFNRVNQIWIDSQATMYITDFLGSRVRLISTLAPAPLRVSGPAQVLVGSGPPSPYPFDATNPGTVGPATGVTLSDPLPSGTTFVSASATQGSCSEAAGSVTCALGPLAASA